MPASGFAASSPIIDWGVSWRALPGERESGDLHVVSEFENGVLIGVVDGLGHGPEAAAAARVAAQVLQAHAGEPVIALVKHCHDGLRKTRGVVLSIASLDAGERTMSWIAVGNVEGVLFRADRTAHPARETVLMRSGVVGYQLPPLRAASHPLKPDDVLIFATDGIKDAFTNQPPLSADPQEAATDILNRFGKDSDDALVLVARWRGTPP
jgi:negative regulator of sigma-B (phosphoserine phosphatase)